MNLAWIAAVYSPYEIVSVTAHQDRDSAMPRSEADLAALLVGRRPSWEHGSYAGPPSGDEALLFVAEAIEPETRTAGVNSLVEYLANTTLYDDVARTVALALIASAASALLEEYEISLSIINRALDSIEGDSPSDDLCRAALLQQRALRVLDQGGSTYGVDASSAALLVDRIENNNFPEFSRNIFSSSTSSEVIRQILHAIKLSAWSLIPFFMHEEGDLPFVPTPEDRARTPSSERILSIRSDVAGKFSYWLSELYAKNFSRSNQMVIGGVETNLHLQLFAFEILGHADVLRVRRDAAMMQILSDYPVISGRKAADCLRLLRQGGADDELSQFLVQIVSGGPVDALLDDSRQIRKYRIPSAAVRPAEMMVLAAAAEVLPASEAFELLESVLGVISTGGPSNPPRRYQVDAKREESAWFAAASLAATAGASGLLAEKLYARISDFKQHDELWGGVFSKVINKLDWDQVPEEVRSKFESFAIGHQVNREEYPFIGDALLRALGMESNDRARLEDTPDQIIKEVNRCIRSGENIEPPLLSDAIALAVTGMRTKSDEAAMGRFSGGGIDPAELAAFLVTYADGPELWHALLDFLVNPAVSRTDRTRAFDVLAARQPAMPQDMKAVYERSLVSVLEQIDDVWGWSAHSITPYPAALRFLFSYSLIDDHEAFQYLARLSASSDRDTREEAAATVSRFAEHTGSEWIQVLALQLSHDTNPIVRTRAIRALALIVRRGDAIAEIATRRLVELLQEDGITIPLRVLGEISGDIRDRQIRESVLALRTNHPSKRVRDRAAKIVLEGDWRILPG